MPSDGVGGLIVVPTEREKLPETVIVSGRDVTDGHDVFVGLDLATGKQLWRYQYEAAIALDYGNSPRATPVYSAGVLVTLGASGILSAVDPSSGVPLWTLDFKQAFDAEIPTWGFSGSPLVIDSQILVQVASDPALIALDLFTGEIRWRVTGQPAAYSSLMPIHQGTEVIGVSEEGYFVRNAPDGRLLWSVAPEHSGDFGVPAPVLGAHGVIFTSENNGVQLFASKSKTLAKQVSSVNPLVTPDSHTPVLVGNQLLVAYDGVRGLNVDEGLTESWSVAEDSVRAYASIIASHDRALVTTEAGEWLLLGLDRSAKSRVLDQQTLSRDKVRVLSHPAVHRDLVFIRVGSEIRCYRLPQ
jgi:outer membrane protein assembly factor BamB